MTVKVKARMISVQLWVTCLKTKVNFLWKISFNNLPSPRHSACQLSCHPMCSPALPQHPSPDTLPGIIPRDLSSNNINVPVLKWTSKIFPHHDKQRTLSYLHIEISRILKVSWYLLKKGIETNKRYCHCHRHLSQLILFKSIKLQKITIVFMFY